jgi:WhiB family redox-sensing transcriptional regulator
MELAACAGMPIETFFPAKGQAVAAANARTICASCEVRPQCLAYARSFSDTSGVWAGTTERERRHLGRGVGRSVLQPFMQPDRG